MQHLVLLLSAAVQEGGLQEWMTSRVPLIARTTISIAEGAPSNSISALAYGKDGVLWVGSSAGLARYDGATFERFLASETPGLDGDRIQSLLTDRQGRTWIGGFFAAPSVLENRAFRRVCDMTELSSVTQFLEARDGSVWMVGSRVGRERDGTLEVFGDAQGLPESTYYKLVEDADGDVWVASESGVFRGVLSRDPGGNSGGESEGDRQSGTWEFRRADTHASNATMLGFDGSVWTSRQDGFLASLTLDTPQMIRTGLLEVLDELPRGPGERLVCTRAGVFTMRQKDGPGPGFELLPIEMPFYEANEYGWITCLLDGPEGGIWGGTGTQGLGFLQRRYVKMFPLGQPIHDGAPGLSVPRVVQLPDQQALTNEGQVGIIWLVTRDGEKRQVEFPDSTYRFVVASVEQSGVVWVATSGGVTRFEDGALLAEEGWEGNAGQLAALPDGSVWVYMESEAKIRCLVKGRADDSPEVGFSIPTTSGSEAAAPAPRASGQVTALGSLGGDLVAATPRELLRFDRARGVFEQLADLGGAIVRQFREGPGGALRISTYGAGLYRIQVDGHLDHWSIDAGLPEPFLGWIAPFEDDGQLWLNSNSGVLRLSIVSLDAYAEGSRESIESSNYPAPECNGATGAQLTANILALPTIEGLAIFDRSAVPPPAAAPTITLLPPLAGGVPISEAGDLVGAVDIQFEFVAPVFPTVEGSRFQYRLPGIEDDWVNVGWGKSVRFPALPVGDYRFEMRGRTHSSHWSKPVHSALVQIKPAWHERTLNRVLLLAALLALGWGYLRLRVGQFRRRNAALRWEIKQRTLAEAETGATQERFRQLFHSAPSAIVSWSPEGEVLDRNGRANTLFGWADDPTVHLKPWDAFENPELGREVFREVLESRESLTTVAITRTADDQLKRCQWHLAATLDARHNLYAVIALVMDLSQRDTHAKNMRALRSNLARVEEQERGRIARELHDDLAQRLAALSLGAQFLSQSLETEDPEVRSNIQELQTEVDDITRDLHSISRQLHPTIVDDLGLQKALRSECTSRDRLTDAEVSFEIMGDVEDPPRDTALALFRVAQEATRNAIKHSGAEQIVVRLQVRDEELELHVIDNGRGFKEREQRGREGLGLRSMQERVTLAGGELTLDSRPGAGTKVIARVSVYSEA